MAMKYIGAKALRNWLEKGEAILLDVRDPKEYEAEHIPCSVSSPGGKIHADILPHLPEKKVVLYCRSGVRSDHACTRLQLENADMDIYQLQGGMDSWKKAGYAVAGADCFIFSLGRQVQLLMGLGILLATGLGIFFNTIWFVLVALLGVEMIFSGLTGWKGVYLLIAAMPWNRKNHRKKGMNTLPGASCSNMFR